MVNRIQKICEQISSRVVLEIGCDHAYITKELFCKNKIDFAYLVDISEKCLQKAKFNLANYKNTLFLVGDGFKALEKTEGNKNYPPIEQTIIAGMGGREIIKILEQDKLNRYNNLVLQPQKNVLELKTYLQQNNFEILTDDIVQEGKLFYFILKVKKTNGKILPLTQNQYYFGMPSNMQTFKNYLTFKKQKLEEISKIKQIEENKKLLNLIQNELDNL